MQDAPWRRQCPPTSDCQQAGQGSGARQPTWFQGSVHSGCMLPSLPCLAQSRSRPSLQAAPRRGPSGCAATPNGYPGRQRSGTAGRRMGGRQHALRCRAIFHAVQDSAEVAGGPSTCTPSTDALPALMPCSTPACDTSPAPWSLAPPTPAGSGGGGTCCSCRCVARSQRKRDSPLAVTNRCDWPPAPLLLSVPPLLVLGRKTHAYTSSGWPYRKELTVGLV